MMQKETAILYSSLSVEQKKEILTNLDKHKKMQIGFYSPVYSIIINNEKYDYRFRSKLNKDKKEITIIFSSNEKYHKPYSKGNIINFYDNELKKTLKIYKKLVEEELDAQINFNLSNEQKELLSEGHDVTLEVTNVHSKNTGNKTKSSFLMSKKELKSFVADYSFFLGKTSLLIREIKEVKKSNNNILNLTR